MWGGAIAVGQYHSVLSPQRNGRSNPTSSSPIGSSATASDHVGGMYVKRTNLRETIVLLW